MKPPDSWRGFLLARSNYMGRDDKSAATICVMGDICGPQDDRPLTWRPAQHADLWLGPAWRVIAKRDGNI